jgi:hypothetical protein
MPRESAVNPRKVVSEIIHHFLIASRKLLAMFEISLAAGYVLPVTELRLEARTLEVGHKVLQVPLSIGDDQIVDAGAILTPASLSPDQSQWRLSSIGGAIRASASTPVPTG